MVFIVTFSLKSLQHEPHMHLLLSLQARGADCFQAHLNQQQHVLTQQTCNVEQPSQILTFTLSAALKGCKCDRELVQ
jgi:hypothetical protein